MYNNGHMDGACDIYIYTQFCNGNSPPPNPQYTYVSNADNILNPYFQIAEQYGFANWMFQTNQGPSYPAHQFLFSGSSAPVDDTPDQYLNWFVAENTFGNGSGDKVGCVALDTVYAPQISNIPPYSESRGSNNGYPCYSHPTMATLLDNAAIGWAYYADKPYQIWTTPNSFVATCGQPLSTACTQPDWANVHTSMNGNGAGPGQLLNDIWNCNLAPVSCVTPDGAWSDHAGSTHPTTADGGPSWVAAIVNAIGGIAHPNCGYWGNTVILVLWDDWGGFYDDVLPYNCQPGPNGVCSGYPDQSGKQYVYGFRVPLLVVSAYTKYTSHPQGQPYVGYISDARNDGTRYVHDFGSILNFIEYVFGSGGNALGQIGDVLPYADACAPDAFPNCPSPCTYSLSDFFDFNGQQRIFYPINGAKYPPSCFTNPGTCQRGTFPEDPDDDVIEDEQ